MLLPETVAPGDFVPVHAGFAMQTVDRDTAEESLRFFSRLVAAAEAAGERPDGVPEQFREIFARGTIAWGDDPAKPAG